MSPEEKEAILRNRFRFLRFLIVDDQTLHRKRIQRALERPPFLDAGCEPCECVHASTAEVRHDGAATLQRLPAHPPTPPSPIPPFLVPSFHPVPCVACCPSVSFLAAFVAGCVKEALKIVHTIDETEAFDVIIMDVNMQSAGGILRGDDALLGLKPFYGWALLHSSERGKERNHMCMIVSPADCITSPSFSNTLALAKTDLKHGFLNLPKVVSRKVVPQPQKKRAILTTCAIFLFVSVSSAGHAGESDLAISTASLARQVNIPHGGACKCLKKASRIRTKRDEEHKHFTKYGGFLRHFEFFRRLKLGLIMARSFGT